jgi:Ca-activated chloride channel family protein
MNASLQHLSNHSQRRISATILSFLLTALLLTSTAYGDNAQLVLKRGDHSEHKGEYKGVVDLAIDPGFEGAKVSVAVDGQKIADGVLSPYHVIVDFGPLPVQHKITITATGAKGKRVKWTETINQGNLPLSINVRQIEPRLFEVHATAPKEDPIEVVQLWDEGRLVAETREEPYRFTVADSLVASGFVQVTARTKGGEETADFWSPAGNIVAEEMQVRTVPIFVSVVDRNGQTRDDVDRSQFRIIDNEAEGKIIEFGKAFDQPISIALLVDASASMTQSMQHASKAAQEFVQRALKDGDRCSITAIQDVPRRKQPLTSDRQAVEAALRDIKPTGRTALYDAVASAIRELREEKNRRAIVVMTDGGDTTSSYSYDDVHKMAREAGIPMYFIAYEGGDNELRDLDRLKYLAAETGGFVATATQQNLLARYTAIEKDLRAQFAILYQVSDLAKPNQYRRVRVVLSSPKLEARTIKGYFTP